MGEAGKVARFIGEHDEIDTFSPKYHRQLLQEVAQAEETMRRYLNAEVPVSTKQSPCNAEMQETVRQHEEEAAEALRRKLESETATPTGSAGEPVSEATESREPQARKNSTKRDRSRPGWFSFLSLNR